MIPIIVIEETDDAMRMVPTVGSEVFMNFDLTEEHTMIRDTGRGFANKLISIGV